MKSVDRPVDWVAPWVQLVVIAATFTPRPTCAGFVPPRSAAGAPPARITCESVSWKTVWDPLKPTVLTLAMLLPVTSILVWCARRPEMAENMERSTGRFSSGVGVAGRRESGRAGQEGLLTAISVRRPTGTLMPSMTATASPPRLGGRAQVTTPVLDAPVVSV